MFGVSDEKTLSNTYNNTNTYTRDIDVSTLSLYELKSFS